ncbi:hypothetical protein NRB_05600 [Novosphingobium sp. 11B]
MKLKNVLVVAMAAAGVLGSPIAAHASATASAATGTIANVSSNGARQSTAVRSKHKADGEVVALAVVGTAVAGYGIYKAVDDDKSKGS